MIILNFSHPLSAAALADLASRYGPVVEERRPAQFDLGRPLAPQVAELVADVPAEFVLVPPALAAAAILTVEQLTRQRGRPELVRLTAHGTPPVFVVAEIF